MKTSLIPILIFLIYLPAPVLSQESSFTHYGIKDGLPSATVYCSTLDKEGFLWFGTENGLSRFDGTQFKNFSKIDGLPDNEILEMFTDSKGRIWIAPFKNEICYYYKGKIHTRDNDSILARVKLKGNIAKFAEDKKGNIFFNEFSGLAIHILKPDGKILNIDSVAGEPIFRSFAVSVNVRGNFVFLTQDKLVEIVDDRFIAIKQLENKSWTFSFRNAFLSSKFIGLTNTRMMTIETFTGESQFSFVFPDDCLKPTVLKDSFVCFGRQTGATLINLYTNEEKEYLKGKPVSGITRDAEGGQWFTTVGMGIYRMNTDLFQNYIFTNKKGSTINLFSFNKFPDKLLLGADLGYVFELTKKDNGLQDIKKYNITGAEQSCQIRKIERVDDNEQTFYTNTIITKMNYKKVITHGYYTTCKSVAAIPGQLNLVATINNVITFDARKFKILDTVWNGRSTVAFYRNDTFFIGALDGLYLLKKNGVPEYWGKSISAFRNRISDIKEAGDGTLWFATLGDGILGYKDHKIIHHLTADSGLTSNICRNIFIDDHYLWVGTDKGLNRINLTPDKDKIIRYSSYDGLCADMVNATFTQGDDVYVATTGGLSIFNHAMISQSSGCNMKILGIQVAGKNYPTDTTNFIIPHQENKVQFDFVGISYKSAGNVSYQYRLSGLDSTWQPTRQTSVNYPTLPSGNYIFQVKATNRFGIQSDVISVPFSIKKLVWEESWFRVLMAIVAAALIWLLLAIRIRFIRKQEMQKQSVERRINELEQLALKSQMNPHFIFNSLNSIQQYVIQKDVEGANNFITSFSHLMRQTMYFSSRQYITIAEELDYLSTYLQLERERFDHTFNFEINIARNISTHNFVIPPMILQPFVENSIRHGIRFREDNAGMILINVIWQNDHISIVIEDNGVGRKMSQQFKGRTNIEYQSKGMSLTSDRIKIINDRSPQKITISIDDLEDKFNNPLGTRITLLFPPIEN